MPNGMSAVRVEPPKRRSVIFPDLERQCVRSVRVLMHKDMEGKTSTHIIMAFFVVELALQNFLSSAS
jgi:hypothetical protein